MSEYKKASAYIATVKRNAAKGKVKETFMSKRLKAIRANPSHQVAAKPAGYAKGRALAASVRAPQRIRSGHTLTQDAIRSHHKGKTVLTKQTAKKAGEKLAEEATRRAKGKGGAVSKDVKRAGLQVKAQITGKKLRMPLGAEGSITAKPAVILRRPNINDLHEIDKAGLSFPSLHDEFQKTMSLLHGGEVGDHL